MKNFFVFLSALAIVLIFTSCEKEEIPEPEPSWEETIVGSYSGTFNRDYVICTGQDNYEQRNESGSFELTVSIDVATEVITVEGNAVQSAYTCSFVMELQYEREGSYYFLDPFTTANASYSSKNQALELTFGWGDMMHDGEDTEISVTHD